MKNTLEKFWVALYLRVVRIPFTAPKNAKQRLHYCEATITGHNASTSQHRNTASESLILLHSTINIFMQAKAVPEARVHLTSISHNNPRRSHPKCIVTTLPRYHVTTGKFCVELCHHAITNTLNYDF